MKADMTNDQIVINNLRKEGIKFVRSQDQLALDNKRATELRLSLDKVLETFGIKVIYEIFDYGAAVIVRTKSEPARTLKNRRKYLGLSIDEVAAKSKVAADEVRDCENTGTRTSIHILIKVAKSLGLDSRFISWKSGDPNNGYLY